MSGSADAIKKRVIGYYESTTEQSYLANWSGDSLGFHFGLADEGTTSLAESIANTNAYLADRAGITSGMRVLDAGCGVGGSAIWLARERKAQVTGITLVERQVELGRGFARKHGVEHAVELVVGDMLETKLQEASFDVVWCIESVCHVAALDDFLAHVAFLLRDGGGFACVDLCSGAERDEALERRVCDGWALAALRPPSEIVGALERAGFEAVTLEDLSGRAAASARALESMASRSLLKLRAERELFGQEVSAAYEAHVRAALSMVEGLRLGKTSVQSFFARRPSRPQK